MNAPAELWTAAHAAAADRYTMDVLGLPSPVLMERASLCVAHEIAALRGHDALPVVVLVGPGNNGGDGLATARLLRGWGIPSEVVLCTEQRNEAAAAELAWARAFGVTIHATRSERERPDALPSRAIVVDALLGTGSRGQPRGGIAAALAWQRTIHGPRVAIDVPSGIDVDGGEAHDEAFRADLTVTFGRSKPGLHVTPGRAFAGRVVVADIGLVTPEGDPPPTRLIDPADVRATIEGLARVPAAHKGQRGHVAVVGGGLGTPGAAVLAGTAALRGGAGLCTIVSDDADLRAQLVAHRPELMVSRWDDEIPCPSASALVVGPGLTDADAQARLGALWTGDPRPAAWDASALVHVPVDAVPGGPRIVTPHPGEAARMLAIAEPHAGWSSGRVQTRRLEAARLLARRTGAVVVLKGEGTVVAVPDGRVRVAVVGSSALATAGSGDCLAGLCGACLARGLDPVVAASVSVHVHGLAGDLAAERRPGAVASDIADAIGLASTPEAVGTPSTWPRLRRG